MKNKIKIMEIKEYEKIIGETAIYPREVKNFGVAYCIMGLFDEINEYMEKYDDPDTYTKEEINAERFDCMWYVCALCTELGLNFEEQIMNGLLIKEEEKIMANDYNPFRVFGMIKKYYRDGKTIDTAKIALGLQGFISGILEDMTFTQVKEGLAKNYEKLMDRRQRNVVHGDGDNR